MMKRRSMLKIWMLCLILTSLSVTTITAYLADGDSARNVTTVGGNNISIIEEFEPKTIEPGVVIHKKVNIKNDGPNTCYVRVRAVFSDSDIGTYAQVDWNEEDWVYDASDEYFYYKYALNKDDLSKPLMQTVQIGLDLPEDTIKNVDLIIYAESYQAYGFSNYKEAWVDYQKNIK